MGQQHVIGCFWHMHIYTGRSSIGRAQRGQQQRAERQHAKARRCLTLDVDGRSTCLLTTAGFFRDVPCVLLYLLGNLHSFILHPPFCSHHLDLAPAGLVTARMHDGDDHILLMDLGSSSVRRDQLVAPPRSGVPRFDAAPKPPAIWVPGTTPGRAYGGFGKAECTTPFLAEEDAL